MGSRKRLRFTGDLQLSLLMTLQAKVHIKVFENDLFQYDDLMQ